MSLITSSDFTAESDSQSRLPPMKSMTLILFPRNRIYPSCPLCNLTFAKHADLKNHLEEDQWVKYKEVSYSNAFHCEQCCLFFASETGFNQHVGKVHITKKKHSKCVYCKKTYKDKYSLKFHVRQVHKKSTRETCNRCGKEFYNKYQLPRHLLKCGKKLVI